jgi:putative membrane protein
MDFFYFLLFPETGFAIAYQQKNTVQIITADTLESPVFTINKTKNMEHILVKGIINSLIFSGVGIFVLIIGYLILEKMTPENTWKEIVNNKNVALAIVFGAFIIGISIIISAAIHG